VIVVDSNVISELVGAAPASAVLAWFDRQASAGLVTTAITAAEVRYGIARLPEGQRGDRLLGAAEEVFGAFPAEILPFDAAAAAAYADLVADRERAGRPIDGFDAQIAASCRVHQATLATRDERDFDHTGVTTTNPWQHNKRP